MSEAVQGAQNSNPRNNVNFENKDFYQNYVNFWTLCTWNFKSDFKIGFIYLKLLYVAIFNHLSQFYHKKICEGLIEQQNHFFQCYFKATVHMKSQNLI